MKGRAALREPLGWKVGTVSMVRHGTARALVVLVLVVALVGTVTPRRADAFFVPPAAAWVARGVVVKYGPQVAKWGAATLLAVGTVKLLSDLCGADHAPCFGIYGSPEPGTEMRCTQLGTNPSPWFPLIGGAYEHCVIPVTADPHVWRAQGKLHNPNGTAATTSYRLLMAARSDPDQTTGAARTCYENGGNFWYPAEFVEDCAASSTDYTTHAPGQLCAIQGVGGCKNDTVYLYEVEDGVVTWSEIECYDLGTGAVTTVSGYGVLRPFEAGMPVDLPELSCPPGTTMSKINITQDGAGTAPGSGREIFYWEADTEVFDFYPDCAPRIDPSWVPCPLEVWKILPDQSLELCDPWVGNCQGWWEHSQRDAIFECHWGPYVLPAEQCRDLAPFYNQATIGQTSPNTALSPPASPQPEATTADPQTQPAEAPAGGTSTGSQTLTLPDPTPGPQHGHDGSCWQNMEIGWNPVSWVLEPIKCAFIPTQTATQVGAMQQDLEARPPWSVAVTLRPAIEGLASGWASGGCGFSPMVQHIPGYGTVAESEFPCTPPYQGNVIWQAAYSLMQGAIVVGGALRLWNMTSAALGGRSTGDGGE